MASVFSNMDSVLSSSMKYPKIEIPIDSNLASEFHKRLILMINDFNQTLDADNEVGLQICNFGEKKTVYINDVGYWNPSLIVFYGIESNTRNPVQLIQHISQINILLIKLPKKNINEPNILYVLKHGRSFIILKLGVKDDMIYSVECKSIKYLLIIFNLFRIS